MKTRSIIIKGLVIALFIFIFYRATNVKTAMGFIWEANKDGKTIYLIGALHPADKKINFENDNIDKIVNTTDYLAVEMDQSNPKIKEAIVKKNNGKAYLNKGELNGFIQKSENEKFYKILDEFNLKYNDVKNLTPYGFIGLINNIVSEELKLNGQTTDSYLTNKYKDLNKEILSLENVDTGIIDVTTDELRDFIMKFESKESIIEELLNQYKNIEKSYINGDESYFLKTADTYADTKSNIERNSNMANEINRIVNENKKCAVVVGTYHFLGKNSILNELEQKGYKITKIEN
ncbi:TraB/GumN family protein [Paraclostridium sordellii]|uniref:TraB/GumN family protein n=2 Tax=Paraclostridium sordellii TaxID=1505 RepID=UPI0005E90DF4|nr:TraB/GumN family protein [Paeniclostridium sordellii]CEP79952.1 GumN family protein [[Clostridium] sordellii] [Paeniclostridium sordellii]